MRLLLSIVIAALLFACGADAASGDGVADSGADVRDGTTDAQPGDAGQDDAGEVDATRPDAADVGPPVGAWRVVSLNLRCLIDDWDARLPIIVDGLAEVDPHLMGFQEVCDERNVRDGLAELVAGLAARTGRSYATHRAVTHRAWDRYDEGLAIVSVAPLDGEQTENLPSGSFPRKLLLVRVAHPDTGQVLRFANTHLDHQNAATRKLQAEAMVEDLAAFGPATSPLLLTGDFNEAPGDGAVNTTLSDADLVDLWAALRPGEAGPTMPATNPDRRIDYVWMNAAGSGLRAVSIERLFGVPVAGVTASDHLGLAATVAP